MNHSNDILNDLVSATRDGKTFYEHAAGKVRNPELKSLFTRLATVKSDIVAGLSNEIRMEGGKPVVTGTWTGDFQRLYADIRSHLGDKNYAYVAQLEESEDQLLKAFNKALNDVDISSSARTTINQLMPELRTCHDIMKTQKVALKQAA